MRKCDRIAVLCGGYSSSEREVSLRGGQAVYLALKTVLDVIKIQLDVDEIPDELDSNGDVIFPVLHGEFGEDGQLQRLLEERGFNFAGSDSYSSALCMNKLRTKSVAIESGINTPKSIGLEPREYKYDELADVFLAKPFVVKPVGKGSSVGVHKIFSENDWLACCDEILKDHWFAEEHIDGRELTVPILGHKALPIIEITPKDGFYDYEHKYTDGMTNYTVPARLDGYLASLAVQWAEKIYANCGCRDFGRVDFILSSDGVLNLLEVNTIPGMTTTSLLPKSAACKGLSFTETCIEMITPALDRAEISLKMLSKR